MADTHEEQLLSTLLGEIGGADRAAQTHAVAALEARVLASFDAARSGSRARMWKPVVVAGMAAALVMTIGRVVWLSREAPAPVVAIHPAAAAQSSERPAGSLQLPATSFEPPAPSSELPVSSRQLPVRSSRSSTITQPPIAQSPRSITQSPVTQSPMQFLPLGPFAEQELSGPFQLVRVQVPLASLGGLTSPLQHPGELVTADVLLGEDGVARGIRITSDEANYPWRFR